MVPQNVIRKTPLKGFVGEALAHIAYWFWMYFKKPQILWDLYLWEHHLFVQHIKTKRDKKKSSGPALNYRQRIIENAQEAKEKIPREEPLWVNRSRVWSRKFSAPRLGVHDNACPAGFQNSYRGSCLSPISLFKVKC